ncbi:helix-turn-helix domain-containing protein [Halomonas sp. NPDC076908]|uniref:helix-turn-helix domain-containing protein n=1 Tax=Halomonadaceae TaxID=28256 RepID=UPI0030EF6A24|tara:strand:+ start:4825 stop:5079 length:255 start_codon:yes stop_codon:yes gene_type:complete
MGELAKTLGQNIREERKKKGFSQDAFALAAGIDRSYIGRVERGEVNITVEKLYEIAAVLQCEPASLLPDQTTLEPEGHKPAKSG